MVWPPGTKTEAVLVVLRPSRTPSTHMIPVQILLKENGSFLGNMLRENKTRFLNKFYLITISA